MMTKGKISLNRRALKNIAIVSMLMDHAGLFVVYNLYGFSCYVDGVYLIGDLMPTKAKVLYGVYIVMRCIGRIAFPIFCYMVVEGFLHTHSRQKYLLRLVIFALISEIPFDMAFTEIFDFSYQNVIWLYVIAVLMMWFIERFAETQDSSNGKRIALTVVAVLIACALSYTCDYSIGGMLLISSMYIFRDNKQFYWIGCLVSLAVISISFGWMEIFGVLALLLLELYNGEKGKGSKYLFYTFYPIHLIVLGIAASLIRVLFEYGMI